VSFSVLATKLYKPMVRPGLVSRSRLTNLLNGGLDKKLILISAPAGYGKTTLLSTWATGCENPVAWLTLDEGDNESVRFWRYVDAALQTIDSRVGKSLRPEIFSTQSILPEQILTDLLNDIAKVKVELILVLEDYHLIDNFEVHASVNFLLEHLPPRMHLIITTRSDPPLQLPLWRGRAQMMEIRAEDLRFTPDEAASFINQTMQLGLTSNDIVSLEERTEGWITGLQMAALALQGISRTKPEEISFFVRNFAGSNRYILDYLVEEVLNHQPQEIQDFLLQTSILETLSRPLCNAVTGIRSQTSEGETCPSQQTLEYLERSNLFLVSLDPERLWYRYHRLFADLLRARLEQSAPQQIPELHTRASEWHELNQRFPDAINHALDAKNYGRACHLIEGLVEDGMPTQTGMPVLWGWIRRLPPEMVLTRPWLCIAQAMSAMFCNDVDGIEPLLIAAERAIQLDDRNDLHNAWKGYIASLKAFVSNVNSDVPGTIENAQMALECLRPVDAVTRSFAKYMLGRAYYINGNLTEAIATLTDNVYLSIEANLLGTIALSISLLSIIYRTQGRLQASLDLLADGRAHIESIDPRRVTISGLAFVGQAIVLHERNNLDEGERIIRRSLELCKPWSSPSATCRCYMVLARILLSQGKLPAAEEALRFAEESIRGRNPVPEVICDLNAVLVEFWLATDQLSRASQWAQEWQKSVHPEAAFSMPKEQNEITLARVMIAERNLDTAIQILGRVAAAAEGAGRLGNPIQIRNLQAIAFHDYGEQLEALKLPDESLTLAQPERYIRIYVDQGERMREMLQAYTQEFSSENIIYTQELLRAFVAPDSFETSQPNSSNLIEPLTVREIEILQAVGEGLSNRQIAKKFFIAEGTVKFYVHAVLSKLGVHSRTQAVFEAKKQKLI